MNRLESCKVALRSELEAALLSHRGIRAWHYGLNFNNTDHPSSLSTYLGLTREEYKGVLVICGLTAKSTNNKTKSTRVKILGNSWHVFLSEIGIGSNYFDKFNVSSIQERNVLWLQLGDMERIAEKTDRVDEMN